MKPQRVILIGIVLAAAVFYPFYTGAYLQSVALSILTYMALAVSWDMLLRSGQISLGIAGFFGLGAYTSLLASLHLGVHGIVGIVISGLLAFLVAGIIGFVVLRLRGLYFAIVTLALAEIFRVIVRNWSSLTGGSTGEVLSRAIFDGASHHVYWLMLVVALLAIAMSIGFRRSRVHFALTSIRNDETVARTSGINIFGYLLFAFSLTAALQGMAGGAYAQSYAFVTPGDSFSVDFTLLPIAMALLGGIYGTVGPIVGAVVLGFIAEYLKLYVPYGHLVVYGIIIVLVILFMPRGITGLLRERLLERSKR